MGFTGLIFGAIAAAWLVYLVPYFLRHRQDEFDDEGEILPSGTAVTIVRSGTSLAESDAGAAEVSTPLTRRSALRELRMLEAQAAQRRRRVLIFLLFVQVVVAGLAAFGVGPWWGALIPFGLILAFVVVARFSVRAMRADLDRRAAKIRRVPDEETVALSLTELQSASHQQSVELSHPIGQVGSLWEQIPIVRPTYMSAPLAPRTVRTIDLSAPVPASGSAPVTADPIVASEDDQQTSAERDKGVG
jgi:hypothetical protein